MQFSLSGVGGGGGATICPVCLEGQDGEMSFFSGGGGAVICPVCLEGGGGAMR